MKSELVNKAEKFATEKHKGQFRKDGSPYIEHPKRVAEIIKRFKKSHKINELIAAALLHDTLEDTDTGIPELRENFGSLVTLLVVELSSDKDAAKSMGKGKYLSNKMKDEKKLDSWALAIKLADRLDNVSDLEHSSKEFRDRYKKETKEILKNLEENRKLSETQQKLVNEIKLKLAKLK